MKKIMNKLSVHFIPKAIFLMVLLSSSCLLWAQEELDVGETGWDVKRPVMASACPNGCPWGELGDFVKDAMEPLGYEVILCRNCNRNYGPGLVSENNYPPPLDEFNIADGISRVNAPVDFGVTSSAMLSSAYHNQPYKNLRLIAKVEDPYYFLVAVNKASGIESFEQIKEEKLPVRLVGNMRTILDYYGISTEDIEAWGGKTGVSVEEAIEGNFDIISGFLASPAMNPESDFWTTLSQKYDLHFLEMPDEILQTVADGNVDAEFVVAQECLLKGLDRKIKTVGRSGEAFFIRDDAPDQVAYDLAKAIDDFRGQLKWYIRIYTYDQNTVWSNFGVPLHPGAEKYYREVGYMRD
ncbi:MAG TPA: TAXI family TRAP transporter solute-binding subunit [Draconibacterium sp.]|nr:TAXI family TRAP transporter solute-binding subunit [Draconibacterium sp.]